MASSFRYWVQRQNGNVEVVVSQHSRSTLIKASVWILAWLIVSYVCWTYRSHGYLTAAGVGFSLLLAAGGALFANGSVRRTRLLFSPDAIRVHTRQLVTQSNQSFAASDARDFGFGIYRSSGVPVLKLEVGPSWIVAAWRVTESDVKELLAAAAEKGLHVFSHRVWLQGTPP
jgi:hypothetical protein